MLKPLLSMTEREKEKRKEKRNHFLSPGLRIFVGFRL